jgi:hypothetical protein
MPPGCEPLSALYLNRTVSPTPFTTRCWKKTRLTPRPISFAGSRSLHRETQAQRAYIPYLGAWSAGAFTVLIALGSQGTDAAIAMAVIALLANGMLQQLIQPIAYGAALGIHPLAVLIVTIAGGALFGTIGLVLAAPLTAAAVKISEDVARGRAPVGEPPTPEPGLGGVADAPFG